MYNESEDELIESLSGIYENFKELMSDPELEFDVDDFFVFLVTDGY
jgi:hypothetical protein